MFFISGKSFIAALMERFYEIDSGNVIIDGVDLKTLDPSWLRCHAIGFTNQEPVLFATSVLENIRYDRPGATDTAVYEAATLANAYDFIDDFPEGYHTILGERGVTVSGDRQKHGIAIARALIKNPSILILDEATSELDAESERIVQLALVTVSRVLSSKQTVIYYRMYSVGKSLWSTIRDADIVVVGFSSTNC
ncbi:ATP-binding cassette [Mactra antiquata]